MTEYQLRVLRATEPDQQTRHSPTWEEIAQRVNHWHYPGCKGAVESLEAAGLVYSVIIRDGLIVWHRTPAGDAALANSDRRVIPKEPIEARLF